VPHLRVYSRQALPDGAGPGCSYRGPGHRELCMGRQFENTLQQSKLLAESKIEMMDAAQKARFCEVMKAEFAKHRWDTFVDEPPSMAQGGSGVVVPGCSICKTRLKQ
jgi:hypothetical protein